MRLPSACLFALILAVVRLKAAESLPAQPEIMPGSASDRRALAVLAKMTLEEKIGQMTQPDFSALASPEQIKTYARVVHILLCGRPLILGEALDLADATVVAWLPGSEGAGVADVLWGKSVPSGKLPVSWPRSMAQIPINVGDAGYDPLFAYGFGLGY